MRFVDEIDIIVASGNGGNGAISFRREAHVPRGGPDGGDGGRGGALVLEATRARNTLVDFNRNKLYQASPGHDGSARNQHGAAGAELVLHVPVGTLVYDRDTDALLADLSEEGQRWVIEGGRGGKGNPHYKTSTRRTPRMAEDGRPGEMLEVRLELKLIADVGLLGYPNAGKSTLLSRVTRSNTKVAPYPFTTLVPQLGVVSLNTGERFTIADIPGLVDGASEGAGLGHQFLRHIERCPVLLHLVSGNPDDEDPLTALERLTAELEAYDPELLERPRLLVLTKIDTLDTDEQVQLTAELAYAAGLPCYPISSVSTDGLVSLIGATWELLAAQRRSEDPALEADDTRGYRQPEL